ncbi:hypothetical protein BX600DRAFT_462040 [Xylariales sp. PMI_506]|nr:hypothetical protein BX600DRAFT_462040 [Xylariales sp. PMI_506]
MSEYWKSTPKYWCKHCSVYVRDTKLERTNHEATGKHQGALKRFLRDLHRNHESEQRDKDRVKREIERLNGVVAGPSSAAGSSSSGATPSSGKPAPQAPARVAETQRQKQWEQLAELGIDVPTELRGDMAMAGEWTVTSTRVVDDTPKTDENGNIKVDAVATGVRKRVVREGEEEEEEAMKGLFKKPKTWGRDSKQMPADDAELDALLSGSIPLKKEKSEDNADETIKDEEKREEVKEEPVDEDQGVPAAIYPEGESSATVSMKTEEATEGGTEIPAVVFKKRKPKAVRQK